MLEERFYCLVAGSRTFNDYELLKTKLDILLAKYIPNIVIVSGGADGADKLAERYAKERGFITKVFPAEWDKYGRRAGFIRNRQMHEYISRFNARGVVLFWDGKSKGTAHSFELAKEFDNPIRTIRF